MSTLQLPSLLRIDSSARHQDSISRQLADGIARAWQRTHPSGIVVTRDLAVAPIPHIAASTIQGFYTPSDQMTPELRSATALSDQLIAELKGAHTLLISAPIYNFGVPSALKAWIDHIVRIGHTFSYDGQQFGGLVKGPRAVLALAYGAGGYADALAAMDHLRPYLTQLLTFLGMERIDVVSAEATTGDPATLASNLATAQAGIRRIFDLAGV